MEKKTKICFNWGISDHFGWGIYGFNLLMYGQLSKEFQVIPLQNPSFLYPIDPISLKFISERLPKPNSSLTLKNNDILLTALGNSNEINFSNNCRNIGVVFNEINPLPIEEINKLSGFDFVICGSSWNASILQNQGIKTETVIQGIDLDLFRSAPKKYLNDKFVIFSGGKLEYRKGQDLVLRAFSIFSQKHKDAVLVTAWRSPWERQLAQTINESGVCKDLIPSEDMGRSVKEWIVRNGINIDQVICLEATPNRLMPEVFREVDLAIFPNRCEGGTNLMAMEALSFGLPCLISKNTGHLDIIKEHNCIPLVDQKPINRPGMSGWGETSIDEILSAMEDWYTKKIQINRTTVRNSVLNHSWENAINSMLNLF